jgi:HSP20 family protein
MFFATPFTPSVHRAYQTAAPSAHAQVAQSEQAYTISLDVPGIAKDQLAVGIEGNVVRIQSKEGAARHIKAAYELPLDIDSSASDARLEHGVLTLTLAKKAPVSNVVQITVN